VKAAAAAQPAAQPAATTAAASGNPFSGYQLYANSYYSSEVISEAIPSLSATSLVAAASKVAEVPSFFWMYVFTEAF
jgi:cellulose 1,4-beta-cellobiosidase